MKTKLISSIILAIMAPSLHAAVITPLLEGAPGSTTSNFIDAQDAARDINAALDGSGFVVGDGDPNTTGAATTLTEANLFTIEHTPATISDNHYLTDGVPGEVALEVLTFDLGGSFDIDNIYLWQYHRSQINRGIIEFDIAFDTGSGFGSAVSMNTLGITDFTIGAIGGNAFVQAKTFTATQTGVQRIQFSNIVNSGDARIGLPELRFGGTAIVVPEPSSTALLGLGGLALILRRRRG